ncbi:MAG: ABC transporter ATP-binding protein [Thermoplasmata archaeon]|nr:ABC transporter ATP-binding protein [Thermoplasmata archaeon]
MSETIIQVRGLVKVYDELIAVNGISFDVKEGQVFAFLGPNGAGKTTTVEIIETIRTATSGQVNILGLDIKKNRTDILRRIGVLPQEFSSFDRLTVRETVQYYSRLFKGEPDIDELLELVNLTEHRDQLYMNLSGGLKQRVGIAVALVNDPEIVFLDEPTTGLDPRARRDVWDVIKGLKKSGKTIFLTTHYMEEAEVLADDVAIISKGDIIAHGTTSQLIDQYCSTIHVSIRGAGPGVEEVAKNLGLTLENRENGTVTIEASNNDQVVEILNNLKARDIKYDGLDIRKANLEEVFLSLTGESLTTGGEE